MNYRVKFDASINPKKIIKDDGTEFPFPQPVGGSPVNLFATVQIFNTASGITFIHTQTGKFVDGVAPSGFAVVFDENSNMPIKVKPAGSVAIPFAGSLSAPGTPAATLMISKRIQNGGGLAVLCAECNTNGNIQEALIP